jgi:lipopolysaccharide biosynthesis regulator YciM
MILGNLLRMKGQVGRAINIHQALLQHPDLTTLEHAYVLLCLGLDFRHGGFVDRAFEAFQDVVRLDPRNRYALANLQKLHEEQHQWADAARVRERILSLDDDGGADGRRILGFLRNEVGRAQSDQQGAGASGTSRPTRRRPADLGDVFDRQGDFSAFREWRRYAPQPERSHLAFDRLEQAYAPRDAGPLRRAVRAAHRRTAARFKRPARPARHLAASAQHQRALQLLLDAPGHHPHGIPIHQAVWRTLSALSFDGQLVRAYTDLTRDAVFYLDPHVCTSCRYRSTELLWQCPQCHAWKTFVEERLTPARPAAVDPAGRGALTRFRR